MCFPERKRVKDWFTAAYGRLTKFEIQAFWVLFLSRYFKMGILLSLPLSKRLIFF